MATGVIQVRKKCNITLLIDLRNKYKVDEGEIYAVIDLGDGSFLFTPRVSQVNRLGDRVSEILCNEDVALDDLLSTLDEQRERYYQEHYAHE